MAQIRPGEKAARAGWRLEPEREDRPPVVERVHTLKPPQAPDRIAPRLGSHLVAPSRRESRSEGARFRTRGPRAARRTAPPAPPSKAPARSSGIAVAAPSGTPITSHPSPRHTNLQERCRFCIERYLVCTLPWARLDGRPLEAHMRRVLLISIAALLGCANVTPAVTPGVKLTPETGLECKKRCGELGMGLDAVVLIQNSAGCVCRPEVAAGSQSGAAAVAGGAMLALAAGEAGRPEDSGLSAAPLILPAPAPLAFPPTPPP